MGGLNPSLVLDNTIHLDLALFEQRNLLCKMSGLTQFEKAPILLVLCSLFWLFPSKSAPAEVSHACHIP